MLRLLEVGWKLKFFFNVSMCQCGEEEEPTPLPLVVPSSFDRPPPTVRLVFEEARACFYSQCTHTHHTHFFFNVYSILEQQARLTRTTWFVIIRPSLRSAETRRENFYRSVYRRFAIFFSVEPSSLQPHRFRPWDWNDDGRRRRQRRTKNASSTALQYSLPPAYRD